MMQLSDDVSNVTHKFTDNLSFKNTYQNDTGENGPNIAGLYYGEEAFGFDLSNGTEWIYPTNYPVREYQKNIVSNALFKNTLVCLPTGLGKTFIAAVVMYNFHRWFPKNIIVFMAHSKPLVAQQVNACCNVMGISPSLIAELNGHMLHSNRKKQWDTKKIFFLTPQVFNNDLARGIVKAQNIRCLIIDEAHKALGNQAYCQVIRSIKPFNKNFRVLALSATPGDDMNIVREVIQNLLISHLELRNEEDPDIKPYLHEKKVETIVIKLDDMILNVKERFLRAVDKYIKPLVKHKALPQSFSSINPFSLVLKQKQFTQDPHVRPELRGSIISNFSVAIPLFYALEELTIHGLRSFITKLKSLRSGEGSSGNAHYRISNDEELKSLIDYVEDYLGPNHDVSFDPNSSLTKIFDEVDSITTDYKVMYSHPKFAVLEEIIQNHFEHYKEFTRAIVFCKSRQCTGEICNFLARLRPLVKPMIFIGQSQSKSGNVTKGFNQEAQLMVMKRFRDGVYNTLIATCVAEEGLDIGEVDLIVNFDSGKNSNTQVQRSGRTGRKRDGRVVNLVTEGKEHQNYNISVSKGKKMNKRLVSGAQNLPFYSDNPKLLPPGINPVCEEMFFIAKNCEKGMNESVKRSRKKKLVDSSDEGGSLKRFKRNDLREITNISDNVSKSNLHTAENANLEIYDRSKTGSKLDEASKLQKNGRLQFENNGKTIDYVILDDEDEATDSPSKRGDCLSLREETQNEEAEKNLTTNNKPNSNATNSRTLPKKYGLELINNLKSLENCRLSNADYEYLLKDDLDTQSLALNLLKLRMKFPNNRPATSFCGTVSELKEPKSKSREPISNLEEFKLDDVDMDDFLCPLEGIAPQSNANIVSSTPIRKLPVHEKTTAEVAEPKMETATTPDRRSRISDMNFHLWDDSDFFHLKDHSPKKNINGSDHRVSSTKKNKERSFRDVTMISITQALDMVKNAEDSNVVKELKKPASPSSPILFFSQRSKPSRSKLTQGSSILTQKNTSRKCLIFNQESKIENPPQIAPPTVIDDFAACDDLFAETEMALQCHLEEVEVNLMAGESEDKNKNSSLAPFEKDILDKNSLDFDLGKLSIEPENSIPVRSQAKPVTEYTEKKNNYSNLSNAFNIFDHEIPNPLCSKSGSLNDTVREERCLKKLPAKTISKNDDQLFEYGFSLFDDDFGISLDKIEKSSATENVDTSGVAKNKSLMEVRDKSIARDSLDDVFGEKSDEGNLSDGAIQAIKAVEEYENDSKLAKEAAQRENSRLIDLGSDDSDEFMPVRKQQRQGNVKTQKVIDNQEPVSEFIAMEAVISDHSQVSSDEENTSGLDDYDSSFVDERENLTQALDVDMTARYLQSTKSAVGVKRGAFKIPECNKQKMNVFSQIASEGESDYEEDSFCVKGGESSVESEMDELERAEMSLEKRKRKNTKVISKRKFIRIRKPLESSDDDEDEPAPKTSNQVHAISDDEIQELFSSSFNTESDTAARNEEPLVVLIASRQVSECPEITTALRARWRASIHVRSTPEADYIVSWRVGINRITLSDFASGAPKERNFVKEGLERLITNFQQPVLIVEDDKNKGLPQTTGCHRTLWAKHSYRTLAMLVRDNVKVLFSRSKDDTARIVALLSTSERDKGHSINIDSPEINSDLEKKLKFFYTLPGVNVANALRIIRKFPTIASFLKDCNSVRSIVAEMGLRKEEAVKVFHSLFSISGS